MDRNIKDVTEENFDAEVVQHPGPVVVLFYAKWCGPSQRAVIDLDSLALTNPKVKFVLLDVDESPDLCEREDVQAMPTLVGYKGKKNLGRLAGHWPLDTTENWVWGVVGWHCD